VHDIKSIRDNPPVEKKAAAAKAATPSSVTPPDPKPAE
jgi:hypothetical protein